MNRQTPIAEFRRCSPSDRNACVPTTHGPPAGPRGGDWAGGATALNPPTKPLAYPCPAAFVTKARSGAGHDLPGAGVAVANHEGSTSIVPIPSVPLQVGAHLGLERHGEHPLGPSAADL